MQTYLTCPTMCAFAFCGTTFPAQQCPHEVCLNRELLYGGCACFNELKGLFSYHSQPASCRVDSC